MCCSLLLTQILGFGSQGPGPESSPKLMETKPRMNWAPVLHFLTLFPHSPRLFISSLSRGSRCRLGLDHHSCHSHFLHLSNLHSLGKSICPATLSLGTQSISFIAFERCPIQGLTLTSTGYLMEPTDEGGASKLSRATNSVRSLLSTLLPSPKHCFSPGV